MDVNLNVLVPNHDVRESAMGGKHQRSLSLSAKWASDKSMAIEYLRRQRDVMNWIETVLRRELPTTDLFELLKSGVVLREMMATLFPDASNCMSPISRSYSMRMAPWKERENISVFLRQCKSIGMNDLSLFCTDDLYEGTNMVQVLFCVQHFMMFSEERAGGDLFMPLFKDEPAEFSNQELEMAMSKIEQAGDGKALQGLRSSVVPDKAAVHEKEGNVRAASEPVFVPSMVDKFERAKDGEPAENEECPAAKAHVETEESGTEADNEEEVAQPEIAAISELEAISVEEAPLVASASAQDVETLVVIELLLLDMAATIEEAETEAQKKTMQSISTVEAEPEMPSVDVINTPDDEAAKEEKEEIDHQVMDQVTEDLALEVKGESIDQMNIEVEVTEEAANPAAGSTDVPLESTPAGEAASTEDVAETTEEAAGADENKTPQTEDEELEAKAMARCMCGSRCSIM